MLRTLGMSHEKTILPLAKDSITSSISSKDTSEAMNSESEVKYPPNPQLSKGRHP